MALPGIEFVGDAYTAQRADVFIPDLWSAEVKRFRDAKLITSEYTKKLPFAGKKGDRLHIPNISRAAVYDKLPERPVTMQARTESEFYCDIDTYKESSFMIEDIVTTQSAYALRSEYTREAGYAIARDIDNSVLALRAAVNAFASQVIFNSSNGLVTGNGAGNPMAFASFLTAKLILDAADVPPEDRVFVVSPGQYAQLLNINQFTNVQFVDGRPVQNGLVGSLFGIPVVMTSQVGTNSVTGYVNGTGNTAAPTPGVNGSPYVPKQDTFTSLPTNFTGDNRPIVTSILCHMDWAVLGIQQEPALESGREPIYQADVVIMTQLYGTRLFRSDHAVLIHSINTLT